MRSPWPTTAQRPAAHSPQPTVARRPGGASLAAVPSQAEALPDNRLFAQYHAPQTQAMKDLILTELASSSKVHVIFATVAMGMGVGVPSMCFVIHVGPPRSMRECMQETGGAGRDGKPSTVILYYNNRAIATN